MGDELERAALEEKLEECQRRVGELEARLASPASREETGDEERSTARQRHVDRREAQRRREAAQIGRLATRPVHDVAARAYGQVPLSEAAADFFVELVAEYSEILDQVLEERTYRVQHNIRPRLHDMASRLGFHRAGPRDLVDVHVAAVAQKLDGVKPQKAVAYKEEGRMLLLELMGYLLAYYRSYFLGTSQNPREAPH
jgi:hypothetical protein